MIGEREHFRYELPISAYDLLLTKSFRYPNSKPGTNTNQMLAIALSNGDLYLRTPVGDHLLTINTGIEGIMDIAGPGTVDDCFLAVMNKEGRMKVYNYTIIES